MTVPNKPQTWDPRAGKRHHDRFILWFIIGKDASAVEDIARNPNVALLKIDALSGEYWDSPGGKVATLVSLVKSKLTGEEFEAENEKFEL